MQDPLVRSTASSSLQSLREEHQGYEKELSRLRAHYEEETRRYKEAQVRALEEMEEKHRAMREEAQQEKEEEKKLLMMVSPLMLQTGTGVTATLQQPQLYKSATCKARQGNFTQIGRFILEATQCASHNRKRNT